MQTVEDARALSDCWRSVDRPVFIVGAARSGTTLLRNLLCAHSRILISHETHYMKLAHAWGAAGREAPENFAAFFEALTRHLQPRAFCVDMNRCRDLIEESGARDFRTAFAALLAADAEQSGKMRAGEKTPGHEQYLDRLLTWFPDAAVIFVRRDPRACVASALEAPWVREQTAPRRISAPFMRRLRLLHVAMKAEEWMESWRAEQRFRSDPRVFVVAYESLVRTPELELQSICSFLGEPWEPAMMSNTAALNADPRRKDMRWRDWVLAHQQRAASPISAASLERWRSALRPRELAVVEALCSDALAAVGADFASGEVERRRAFRLARSLLRADEVERRARNVVKQALGRPVAAPALVGSRRLA